MNDVVTASYADQAKVVVRLYWYCRPVNTCDGPVNAALGTLGATKLAQWSARYGYCAKLCSSIVFALVSIRKMEYGPLLEEYVPLAVRNDCTSAHRVVAAAWLMAKGLVESNPGGTVTVAPVTVTFVFEISRSMKPIDAPLVKSRASRLSASAVTWSTLVQSWNTVFRANSLSSHERDGNTWP